MRFLAKDKYTNFGSWLFLIGILLSLVVGSYHAITLEAGSNFFKTDIGGWSAWFLAIIGLIVGILAFFGEGTITSKETPGFLISVIALVVMAGVFEGYQDIIKPLIGAFLAGISMSLAIFVAPAVIIISIKLIWQIGKDR